MSLDDVVNLTISNTTVALTTQGFGTPLILSFTTATVPSAIEVRNVDDLPDTLSPYSSAYRSVAALFSQNLKPTKAHVVFYPAAASDLKQIVTLTPLDVTAGTKYRFTLDGSTSVDVEAEADASIADPADRLNDLCNQIKDAINGKAGITATVVDGEVVKLEKDAESNGERFNLKNLPPPDLLKVEDDGANLPVDDALTWANRNVPTHDWYGLILADKHGDAVMKAAAWIEQRRKLFAPHIAASRFATDAGTLKSLAYARTMPLYLQNELYSTFDAALFGANLPTQPGSTVWSYKTLVGIAPDVLTPTQVTAIENVNGTYYTTLGGLNVTSQKTKVSAGEWVDTVHGIDWLYARIQESIFAELASASAANRKIPFTDSGADVIRLAIMRVLNAGVEASLLASSPEPWVQIPKVSSLTPEARKGRRLPNVTFGATLAGAILATDVTGTVTD